MEAPRLSYLMPFEYRALLEWVRQERKKGVESPEALDKIEAELHEAARYSGFKE